MKGISLLLSITLCILLFSSSLTMAGGIDQEAVLKGLGLTLLLMLLIHYGQMNLEEDLQEEGQVPEFSFTQEEIFLLSRIIQAEAGGESYQGKVAVGAVVLNRMKSPLFPNALQDVIYAQNQFEPVRSGHIYNKPSHDSQIAALEALQGVDPSLGALYFYNRELIRRRGDLHLLQWFERNTSVTIIIGNHTFAR